MCVDYFGMSRFPKIRGYLRIRLDVRHSPWKEIVCFSLMFWSCSNYDQVTSTLRPPFWLTAQFNISKCQYYCGKRKQDASPRCFSEAISSCLGRSLYPWGGHLIKPSPLMTPRNFLSTNFLLNNKHSTRIVLVVLVIVLPEF
jgi:hypothetical protein